MIISNDEPMYFKEVEIRDNHNIYLSDTIKDPKYYSEIFNIIESALPHDIINLHINSVGGHLWTAMQFVSSINKAKCKVHASIEGEAHSSASIIFLACDTFSVPEFASMLCHYYTSGYCGKGNELIQWSEHIKTHFKTVFKNMYKGFLSPKELEEMFNGKDFWFNGKEIADRLENKVKLEEKELKKELKKTKTKKK